jgi:hypothetical protein
MAYTNVACGYGNVRVSQATFAGTVAASRIEGYSPHNVKSERSVGNSDTHIKKRKPLVFHAKKDSSFNARHATIYRGLKVISP